MANAQKTEPEATAGGEKKFVALTSVAAAIFLASMKLVVGLLTGSLGILSEAAHSGLDLVAALVTYFAVRISSRRADARYTYGYGKVENMSALFETFLLFVTCIWIIYEAVQRLFFKSVEVEASLWSFIIMGTSIAVDFGRSRALARAAKKYNSQALEADALHFSTDIWSSSVVIGGLVLVVLSETFGVPWLVKADAVAALGVAGIVIYVSAQLGYRTIVALLDAVPAGMQEEVVRAARVPGIQQVQRVRVRKSGPETFADIEVTVDPDELFERAREVEIQVEKAVRQILPGADVSIHTQPGQAENNGLRAAIRREANRQGLRVHSIRAYRDEKGARFLELHVEVSEKLNLEQAHAEATALEEVLHHQPYDFQEVVLHIEPVGEASLYQEATSADEARVLEVIQEAQSELGLPCGPHELKVHRMGGELSVSFHCTMAGDTPISETHHYTEQLERLLRSRLPELGRVVIHTECPEQV